LCLTIPWGLHLFPNWDGATIHLLSPAVEEPLYTPSGFSEVSGFVPKLPQKTAHLLSDLSIPDYVAQRQSFHMI
jgi:hypothetical protein